VTIRNNDIHYMIQIDNVYFKLYSSPILVVLYKGGKIRANAFLWLCRTWVLHCKWKHNLVK